MKETTDDDRPSGAGPAILADEAARRAGIREMRVRATGLLVLMSVVFIVARVFESRGTGWLSWVRATAEASMVGALADWFAVVAVFRYPLGLRIPHTAVIQTRKDAIGAGLGEFLQANFLTGEAVAERVKAISPASKLAAWLDRPGSAETVARVVAENLSMAVNNMSDVESMLGDVAVSRLRAMPAGPIAARVLTDLRSPDRQQKLLDAGLAQFDRFLVDQEGPLRARFADSVLAAQPELFDRFHTGLRMMIADILADPAHELRAHFDRALDDLVQRLNDDEELQARVEAVKSELLDRPEVRRLTTKLWTEARRALGEQSRDPASGLRSRLEGLVAGLRLRLALDASFGETIDGAVVRAVRTVLDENADTIASMIKGMVAGWDGKALSGQLEVLLGRDLQFIRINGTVVGGMIGLFLHGITQLIA